MKIKAIKDSSEPKPTMNFGNVISATSSHTATFGGWGVRITSR